jgi:hypothetical protein
MLNRQLFVLKIKNTEVPYLQWPNGTVKLNWEFLMLKRPKDIFFIKERHNFYKPSFDSCLKCYYLTITFTQTKFNIV